MSKQQLLARTLNISTLRLDRRISSQIGRGCAALPNCSKNRTYFSAMPDRFAAFLLKHPWGKVLRILLICESPKNLRELADLSGLSVSGTKDILRRFEESRLVRAVRSGNKILFTLDLSGEERQLLQTMFQLQTEQQLRTRAIEFSRRRKSAIGWIDETVSALRQRPGESRSVSQ